ncbi:hypothetical protein EVJ58_g10527 [Rhodofomes roseus]|uniref:Uncharacterized protein n=1 Tax=Rhodofomes roseus TaxID=34475 RepID=A0A4Y9XN45_9APHY|nr:hypothetical protein EVJ58_g10527 [Rhodofomes roseus]
MSYVHVPIDLSSKDPDSCTYLHRQLAREDTSSTLDGAIVVTDHRDPSPVYFSHPPSSESGGTHSANVSSPASSELELPDIAVEINPLHHIFGHLLDDPRWPYIPAVDKTVEATLEDWITLCHCIRRDPYTFRLWSFTYDLQKQTIHMSSPLPLHQFLINSLNQVLWAAVMVGLIKVRTWTPTVVVNTAQSLKGPIPDAKDGYWGRPEGRATSSAAAKKEKNLAARSMTPEQRALAAAEAARLKADEAVAKAKAKAEKAKAKQPKGKAEKAKAKQPKGKAEKAKAREDEKAQEQLDSRSKKNKRKDRQEVARKRKRSEDPLSGVDGPSDVGGPSAVDDHDPHADADPLADVDPHADADPRTESSGASGAKSSAPVQVPSFPLSHIPDTIISIVFPSGSTVNLVTNEIAKAEKPDHLSFRLVEYMRAPQEEKKYEAPKYSDYVKKCAKESVATKTEKEWAQGWIETCKKVCLQERLFDMGDDPGPTRDQQPWLTLQHLIDGHIFIHRQRAWLTCSDLSVPKHVEELEQLSRSNTARTPATWEEKGLGIAIQDSYDSKETASRRDVFEIRWSAALQNLSRRVFDVCSKALTGQFLANRRAFCTQYGISREEFKDIGDRSKRGLDVPASSLNEVLEDLSRTVRVGSTPTATARLKNFAYDLAFLHKLDPPLENAQPEPNAPVQQPLEWETLQSLYDEAMDEHVDKKQRFD